MSNDRGAGGDAAAAARLFVGVGIDTYDHDPPFAPLQATADVGAVGQALGRAGYQDRLIVQATTEDGTALPLTSEHVLAGLDEAIPAAAVAGGALVLMWSGHAVPGVGGGLRLVASEAAEVGVTKIGLDRLVELAWLSEAKQILIVFDACYSGGAIDVAAPLVRSLLDAYPDWQGWIGVLASARPHERARDGALARELVRVLQKGPRDPALRLRFHAFNEGIRGDDVIEVLRREWPDGLPQQPDADDHGLAGTMFPNPNHAQDAVEEVVEHLLLAARGGERGEPASYFTGRTGPLGELVDWFGSGSPGLRVITGSAGCGKSAVAGRVVSLSNPTERRKLIAEGATGPDPGEGSVSAHVHVRALRPDDVADVLSIELTRKGVLPGPARRNRNQLVGDLQSRAESDAGPIPRIVIDGLDEAGAERWAVAEEVILRLAPYAQVVVATREVERADEPSLIEVLGTAEDSGIIDLSAPEAREATLADLRAYIDRRLADWPEMDPAIVSDHVVANLAPGEGEFLLARLLTSQLREEPADTSEPQWAAGLATTVEGAFERDLRRVPGASPNGRAAPVAARHLLTALAWGFGAGLPDDVWPLVGTAIAGDGGTPYTRDDVLWALEVVGRYVILADGRGYAAYRLSHQRLADHLRPPRPPTEPFLGTVGERVAAALVAHYRALLDAGRAPDEPRYLWLHTWQHCAAAGPEGIAGLRGLHHDVPQLTLDLALALEHQGARYSAVGRHREAVEPSEEAVELFRALVAGNAAYAAELASSLNVLSVRYSDVGLLREAVPPVEEAVELYKALAAEDPAHLPELASALNNLGNQYGGVGRRHEAVRPLEESVELRRGLVETNPAFLPNLAMALNNLGIRYSEVGRRHDALDPAEESVELLRQLVVDNPAFIPELASALNNLGIRYSELGRRHEAVTTTAESVRMRRVLAAEDPLFVPPLASSLSNLGGCYSEVGRARDAVALAEEAADLYRTLAADNPVFVPELAGALNNLGILYSGVGRRAEAVGPSGEAVDIYRRLAEENAAFTPDLAMALNNHGIRLSGVGRFRDALGPTEESVRIRRELAAQNPAFVADLASSLSNLGVRRSELGRHDEALRPAEESVELYRGLARDNPAFIPELASALNNLGIRYGDVELDEEGRVAAEEAVQLRREMASGNAAFVADLASSLHNLGLRYERLGQGAEAIDCNVEAVDLYRDLATDNPAYVLELAASLNNLSLRVSTAGRQAEAIELIDEAITLYRTIAAEVPGLRTGLVGTLSNGAATYDEAGRSEEAIELAREAVTLGAALAREEPELTADLARSLHSLEVCCAAAGRASEGDEAWERLASDLPHAQSVELQVFRALTRQTDDEAVADIVAALGRAGVEGRLVGLARSAARARRAREPERFDACWLAAAGDPPPWLVIDPEHVDVVHSWFAAETFAAAAAVAAEHEVALLGPATDVVLDEMALVLADEAISPVRQLLDAARRAEGFAPLYEILVTREVVEAFLAVDFEQQIALLASQRAVLTSETARRVLVDRKEAGPGTALLALAVAGRDGEALAACDDLLSSQILMDLVVDGAHPLLVALGQVALGRVTSLDQAVAGMVVGAMGMQLAGAAELAADVVRSARRIDQSAVDAVAARLMPFASAQPRLAELTPAFVDPLPPADEEGPPPPPPPPPPTDEGGEEG